VSRRLPVTGVVALLLVVALSGCGHTHPRDALTIGILADCIGPYGGLYESALAAAELPFLERGAALRGRVPSSGLHRAAVGGRAVRVVRGCTDTSAETTVNEARRLVDAEGATIVVGGLVSAEGLALRRLAERRPNVTFAIAVSPPQSLTLDRPRKNVFRFGADSAQLVAGLGAYAYNTLGWRRAVVLGEPVAYDYGTAAGFVAEFCALGGQVVDRLWVTAGTPLEALAARARRTDADGAAVFALSVGPQLVSAFAPRGPLGGRIVTDIVLAGALPAAFGARAHGVAWAWPDATPPDTPASRSYRARARAAFPGRPDVVSTFPTEYYTATEAVARALDATRGETGDRFRAALAQTDFQGPLGRVRLDENRQLVATTQLVTVQARGPRRVRTVTGVDAAFAGAFPNDGAPPSADTPRCVAGDPPPWAISRPTR
jgi:branched-chain amino acid transport system substrate-binding protein